VDGPQHGGDFDESDEFSPNIPQLGRKFRGRRFNQYHREARGANQMRDPFAKSPGLNAAISDPPPDMRLKPPMKGEVDHRPNAAGTRRGSTMVAPRVGNWNKPQNLQAEKVGNKFADDSSRKLSHGDFIKSRAPNY
jgi:hypothetical protein